MGNLEVFHYYGKAYSVAREVKPASYIIDKRLHHQSWSRESMLVVSVPPVASRTISSDMWSRFWELIQ